MNIYICATTWCDDADAPCIQQCEANDLRDAFWKFFNESPLSIDFYEYATNLVDYAMNNHPHSVECVYETFAFTIAELPHIYKVKEE